MNDTVKITLPNDEIIELPLGTKAYELLEKLNSPKDDIIALYINNKIYSLDKELRYNAKVKPVYANTRDGIIIYRRSLCLLLASSAHKLFPNMRLLVGHSLGSGYYYTIEDNETSKTKKITEDELKSIENQMNLLAEQDTPIKSSFVSYEEACEIFENLGLKETRKQLEFICQPRVKINKLDDFTDLSFGPLAMSTRFLKHFELMKYGDGFLLRFPKSTDLTKIPEFEDQPKLFAIYSKYKEWGKKLNVTSSASLNELVINRKINDFIDITETLQEKCIGDIATQIADTKKTRVVLIAGPSSSGKTTTSKKLALELQAIGYKPKVISLDSYYVGHERTPRDENGNFDFECIEALDIELLNQNLIDMFNGKEINLPTYDFHTGKQYFEKDNLMHLEENDILIMEGIHGLNDRLTPKIPNDLKFKIYLSALTQLNLDDHNRISTSDNRLIRRIVRDYNFRGKSASGTIAMWPSVRNGEEKHIFPFQNNADAILNTALDYELSVLKVYAEPLLRCVKPTEPEYTEACTLLHFLDNFATIAPSRVPPRSIIREFIGGSAFKY